MGRDPGPDPPSALSSLRPAKAALPSCRRRNSSPPAFPSREPHKAHARLAVYVSLCAPRSPCPRDESFSGGMRPSLESGFPASTRHPYCGPLTAQRTPLALLLRSCPQETATASPPLGFSRTRSSPLSATGNSREPAPNRTLCALRPFPTRLPRPVKLARR